jgi:uncharacterized repeat protein (TIGR03837 family)
LNPTRSWAIHCRVVDHYGDIGIAWRLARQLRAAHDVRLVVDDLVSFARIEPRLDPDSASQVIDDVSITAWSSAGIEVADVVVELLGCGLPPRLVDAMARAARRPVWIDYEYLSAEAWVDDFHARPSPHPTLPLVKYFFYPGFGPTTGGLLVEPDLDERRAAFVGDADAVAAFRRDLGIAAATGTRYVSLFAYPQAPAGALLEALVADGSPWVVVVPDGVLTEALAAWQPPTASPLRIARIPFLDQDGYDRLLWTCDWNAVRGEDSFVRAQAAGRPFVWHIYPQADGAHRAKLAAFDARFGAALDDEAARAREAWSLAWNGFVAPAAAALDWLQTLDAQARGADRWGASLARQAPLVERLVAFACNAPTSS